MKLYAYLAAVIAVCMIAPAALAADTTVPLSPVIEFLKPWIDMILTALVTGVIGLVAAYLNKFFGLKIDQANRDALAAAAKTAAGNVLAKVEGDIALKSFDVGNPLVAEAIKWVQASAPGAIAHFGLTPDAIGKLILGKIGELQAGA